MSHTQLQMPHLYILDLQKNVLNKIESYKCESFQPLSSEKRNLNENFLQNQSKS